MLKTKRMTVAVMLLVMTVSISGCMVIDFFADLLDPSLIIIRGKKVISGEGEVYTIPKGTTVKFKWTGYFGGEVEGELVIKDGAKLIAQGTADEQIVFKSYGSHGYITLKETADNESIIQYCSFEGEEDSVCISILNSLEIKYNKFFKSNIRCNINCSPTIEYNTFDGGGEDIFVCSVSGYTTFPTIRYNEINNGYRNGLKFFIGESPTIEFNNITGCTDEAIYWGNYDDPNVKLTISNNYISDCNGKSGVDTTGEQSSDGVIYQNPRSSEVIDAGCGW